MKPQRFIKTLTKTERQEIEKLYRRGPNNQMNAIWQLLRNDIGIGLWTMFNRW